MSTAEGPTNLVAWYVVMLMGRYPQSGSPSVHRQLHGTAISGRSSVGGSECADCGTCGESLGCPRDGRLRGARGIAVLTMGRRVTHLVA